MKRILTGITPSGYPHLGNYIGAIKPSLELLDEKCESFLFSIEPEEAHERLVSFIEICSKFPGFIPLLRNKFDSENPLYL